MTIFGDLLEAWRRAGARKESIAAGSPAPVSQPSLPVLPWHPAIGTAHGNAGNIVIPRNRAEVIHTFGSPGTTAVDPAWERVNMVVARDLPGAWNGGKGRLYVHRLAETYVREALRRCADVGCLTYITRLGCFNFRHERHDPRLPLSLHSWGIALDINSEDNAGVYPPRGGSPAPYSEVWRRKYPRGVPSELVSAFESCGWRWGGRWKSYIDPMHFQLCV